jgi:transposase InsO family protein
VAGVCNRHHGIGWEFVHVCIDDASRVAFVQVLADQHKESAVAFLEAAVAYFAKLGVRIERVMTDNGSCYQSKMFRAACKRLGLRQAFTRPYTRGLTEGRALHSNSTARMGAPTATRISDRTSSCTGSIATIGIGPMVA